MKVTICGAGGRMGQAVITMIGSGSYSDIEICGALECDKNKIIKTSELLIFSIDNLDKFLSEADILIDFTNPNSTLKSLEIAKTHKVPVVIGTTGFNESQKEKIKIISRDIPIVCSPNMSIGVNILFKLVEAVAKKIYDYDIEIVELHHNKKNDSPSGTAAKLAEIAATSIGKDIASVGVYGRHSSSMLRKKDEIGVLSVRAGDIVGDHTVYFAGPGERIELTHRAHSRNTFAAGALRAAKWLNVEREPRLYDMLDVLDI
ncbi:MAG: 4-hydroxy-tetrahydrodipicolinate reductase [Endomicrobium sp.]|jgi:4-hydroxy-tetrahydrodipicolinate reductase|nr:4-hydroxy-tetrahydrodipicolinate reductase [Endomicrobium sp.]